MIIGKHCFDLDRDYPVMGILNATPDSFSDGGQYLDVEKAVAHALQMIEEGATIIDVGGESTRPGHQEVTAEEEIARVVPVIKGIRQVSDVAISIDTMKSAVAEAALQNGADMLNDVWGAKRDPRMASIAAKYQVPICLMHNRERAEYHHLIPDVLMDLEESVAIAFKAGVTKDKIILDPGIGFGKSLEDNLMCMRHLEAVVGLGYPVLLGTSRKSMIGLTLGLPVTEREEGTLATTVYGMLKGCHIFRVHNVQANTRAIDMTKAMRGN